MRVLVTAVVILIFVVAPQESSGQVCDLLKVGVAPNTAPNPVEADPPDISKLVMQVYSTRALDDSESNVAPPHSHKCAIASDLSEVDIMMEDVGFAGYSGSNAPLFTNAFITHVQATNDQEMIRNVVREIFAPDGDADPALTALKQNSNLYNEHALNVYYVHRDAATGDAEPFDYLDMLTGMHIRNSDGFSEKMIFIGEGAKADTVAHEFAHAFSAGHVNFRDLTGREWCAKYLPLPEEEMKQAGDPDCGTNEPISMTCEFARENYMWAGSESLHDRQQLGDPQKVRMMRNIVSVISEFSPSTKPLECPDYSANPGSPKTCDDDCPRLRGM